MLTSTVVRSFFSPFLDFLFPRTCLHCRGLLPDGTRYVCEACWSSIERVNAQHSLYKATQRKLLEGGNVDRLASCFVFTTNGVFQSLAHEMKYGKFEKLGIWLGKHVGEELKKNQVTADYLIPIPLHKQKLRERGYNQAELIARGVADVTGFSVRTDVVRRWRFTETQTQLTIDERKKNMKDAFEVLDSKEELAGKNIILLDDVIPTGATITSCASELKAAGAVTIIAASLALAE